MIAKIAKFFLLLIAFLLGLEIIFRIIFPSSSIGQIYIPSNNPRLGYELRPNSKIIFKGIRVKLPPTQIAISSDGLRDYRYTVTKPQGTFRIVILGDSIGFGWGVELEDTFAKRLEARLNNNQKLKYEVINFSVPGYNTLQDIEILKTKALIYHPDLVIMTLIEDDFFKSRKFPRFPAIRYLAKHSALYRFISERMVISEAKRQRESYALVKGISVSLAELKKLSVENKFDVAILTAIKNVSFMEAAVRRCKEYNFTVIDWSLACKNILSRKDPHPDSEGHKLIAEQIYEYLLPKLNNENTRSH
ncbi:MAG: SGNH/GDSL hydrolase family protein [Candidatus Omnitrophica bacterium]|nr:SGNH/GDSL hydrolase family protein [Candidatus Omnitrophota bacterium]